MKKGTKCSTKNCSVQNLPSVPIIALKLNVILGPPPKLIQRSIMIRDESPLAMFASIISNTTRYNEWQILTKLNEHTLKTAMERLL